MYKSPIELYIYNKYKELEEQKENYLYQIIQSYDINVDKEELIKALNYDREQYENGYKEASNNIKEYIIKKLREKQVECFDLYEEYKDGEDYRRLLLLEEIMKIVIEAY